MGFFSRFFKNKVFKKQEDYNTPCNLTAHWDRKRCKSCKSFIPKRRTCLCENGGIVTPWKKACKDYKKRKINARDLVYGK